MWHDALLHELVHEQQERRFVERVRRGSPDGSDGLGAWFAGPRRRRLHRRPPHLAGVLHRRTTVDVTR